MAKSIKANYLFNLINSASQLLFPLITFPYASRIMMADGIGQVNFFQSIISYISLFTCLGIPMYAIREVAKVRDNPEKMTRITVEILLLHAFLTLLGYMAVAVICLTVTKVQTDIPLFLLLSATIFFTAIGCEWFLESWKRFLPDYEIKEWNEDNFDVNIILYTKEAYEAKKYAFVSDYARFWILYHYGGLYFDTDVEVIKPMDNIIAKGPFMGCENEYDSLKIKEGAMALGVAPGLGLGVTPGLGLYKEMLDLYATLSYFNPNGTQNIKTVVSYTSELLVKHGMKYTPNIQLVANVWIYPKDFFCPKDYVSGKIELTVNSVAIHHYGESWQPWDHRLEMKIWRLFRVKRHPLVTWHIRHWLRLIGINF